MKASIITQIAKTDHAALLLKRRLWFMGKQLPIYQKILRIWKTGTCRFSDVLVNEYPLVDGVVTYVDGDLEHHDSPDLHHWVDKQNRYSSVEAIARYRLDSFAATPKLFGSSLERRMWFKKHFFHFPLRYQILLIANLIRVQPWRSGREGLAWARLRVWVWRMREDKLREMRTMGREIELPIPMLGRPHPHAIQANS